MKTTVQIQVSLHSKVQKVRAIQRISHSTEFTVAFGGATEEEKTIALNHIEKCDQFQLDKWILGQLIAKSKLDLLPVIELRKLAQQLGVSRSVYKETTKCTLITEIRKAQNVRSIGGCNPESASRNETPDPLVCQGQREEIRQVN